jgi:hypothetical protein
MGSRKDAEGFAMRGMNLSILLDRLSTEQLDSNCSRDPVQMLQSLGKTLVEAVLRL